MGGKRKLGSAALGTLLVAFGATALPGLARAAEGEFMRDTLSNLGLIEPERPAITYRERAPLAMPPKLNGTALPPPQVRETSPQWPKDPEISRRERAAVEAKKPVVRGAQGRMNDNNETLSVYEMDAGRKAGAGALNGPAGRPGDGDTRESTWLDPLKLFTGEERTEPSVVEPSRDMLTDPPNGYRKAPVKVVAPQGGPVGGPISDNAEADPRAYMRSQSGR
ncbi:hypothetical protein MMB17_06505 [Methylobacterium organophilum]|uniref:hypothetical protein n=1 Tax=Methylobacterium organophilum TaxID=410 RepID=UPI001F13C062|nr:hypothetical protein [Methylobacterium organophilum]UMY18951.1 hypothetical protein MMB17_06505 [Methylobacterium organophilum]